jgi:ribonuclease J
MEVYGYLPRDKVVALCTGSQGEPRAALARIAEDEHPEVTLVAAATRVIFSSRTIPGNEKAVNRVINGLISQGSRSSPTAPTWCTSRAIRAAANSRTLLGWVRRKTVVPVHGEALHLGRARRTRAPARFPCRDMPQRRSGPACAGHARDRRRGAGRRSTRTASLLVPAESVPSPTAAA